MRINHNIASLNTYRQLSANGVNTQKSLEKLSSGLRINRAGDDAAGLAISEKMRGQIRGLDQASRNAQDGISMIQTAEGALNETHSILQRMRELAVQSSNDTNVAVDRSEIQKEIDELAKEVTRIANSTEFNTQKLINGGKSDGNNGSVKFHVGANAEQDITLSLGAMDAKTLGISRDKITSATGTIADAGITGASFAGELGAGVIDGAVLSFDYTAEVTGVTGVAAQWDTGTITAGAGTFTFNGVTVTVANTGTAAASVTGAGAVSVGIAAAATDDDVATAILSALNAYKGSANAELNDFTFALNTDGDGVVITDNVTNGDTNNTLAITGSLAIEETANTVAGVDAVAAKSAKVEITSSLGHSQTVVVDGDATSFKVETGSFKGMTLTMAADVKTDMAGAANAITLAATSSVAAAAQFGTDGTLIDQAVTEAGIDVSTQSNASKAITTIQTAIETVSAERSKLGAYQNRLEHTIANLGTSSENLTAAESRIRDVDMAKEMMEFTKNNILSQAAQAMLAQANQQPQGVLQLLR